MENRGHQRVVEETKAKHEKTKVNSIQVTS
jgi:hypothetical protein